ncbi:MAG: hypothetical protein IH945_02205 [Armatimonadetes bacterium]|nr:hypothetical protein [Armatimonadota bacterium]
MSVRDYARVWKLDISAEQKMVLLYLAHISDESTGLASARVATVALWAGVSVGLARTAIADFTQAGWLVVEEDGGRDGTTTYRFDHDAIDKDDDPDAPMGGSYP